MLELHYGSAYRQYIPSQAGAGAGTGMSRGKSTAGVSRLEGGLALVLWKCN